MHNNINASKKPVVASNVKTVGGASSLFHALFSSNEYGLERRRVN